MVSSSNTLSRQCTGATVTRPSTLTGPFRGFRALSTDTLPVVNRLAKRGHSLGLEREFPAEGATCSVMMDVRTHSKSMKS